MNRLRFGVILCFSVLCGACSQASKTPAIEKESKPRLFEGMGTHHRTVTTSSPKAQQYFDQGLVWAFAFNHDEAIRSFEEAVRIDPDCAMAYWGIALCHGPHINNPIVPPDRAEAAWKAIGQAQARSEKATPVEQALIHALVSRYSATPTKDRRPLDEAYAAAMEQVWKAYSNDTDVCSLYAESLMDLQPWNYWTLDGQPKGRINEILAVLDNALQIDRKHPGINHLYIHAVEAGPSPEKGDASADLLRTAVPASGHLIHMPSHIDVQRGRWSLASDQNKQAIDVDTRYKKQSPHQQFYRAYMAHNYQFLSFSSMMEGCSEKSLWAAQNTIAGIPKDYAKSNAALVDPVMMIVVDVYMRFGKWDKLLAEPKPEAYFPISTAMWHFARSVAFAAKGDLKQAREEQTQFHAAGEKVPADAMMAINKAHQILAIADQVLTGEIAYREKNYDDAIKALREGVRLEDQLLYMEPPEWIQPVRHTLAAILVDSGHVPDAEVVYRDDLQKWPENGWSLFGLAQCLRARGATIEADEVDRRFKKTWARGDVKIKSSCLCVKKP
jgi:tetratricopeptide (TPR) repeat protein